jgi:hypothetical protein
MEAQHIKKKYRIIQGNLLEDSIAFESTLIKIEEAIKKQESEMRHLKVRVGAQVRCGTDRTGSLMHREILGSQNDAAYDSGLLGCDIECWVTGS